MHGSTDSVRDARGESLGKVLVARGYTCNSSGVLPPDLKS